jgi:hypothetical protein
MAKKEEKGTNGNRKTERRHVLRKSKLAVRHRLLVRLILLFSCWGFWGQGEKVQLASSSSRVLRLSYLVCTPPVHHCSSQNVDLFRKLSVFKDTTADKLFARSILRFLFAHSYTPSPPTKMMQQQHVQPPYASSNSSSSYSTSTSYSSGSSLTPSRTIITSFTPRKPTPPPGTVVHNHAVSAVADNGGVVFADEELEELGDWVLCLTAENSDASGRNTNGTNSRTLACALSNGLVQVYDQERLHLTSSHAIFATAQQQPQQSSHHNIIHDLIYGPQNVLVVAGNDGGISVLDLRIGGGAATTAATTTTHKQYHRFSSTSSNMSNSSGNSSGSSTSAGSSSNNSIVARAQLPLGQAALSISLGYDGYLCAVGSNKARVHFFDLRSPHQLLGSYVDAHTDEVTQVKFQAPGSSSGSGSRNTLLTASEDGLVCLFDTTQPTEESALKAVLNIGAPSRKVGFCGPDLNTIYCLTGSETLSFWNADSATCVLNFGSTTRQVLSQATAAIADNSSNNMMSMDYLVDAHWDAASQEFLLLAGTVGGSSSNNAAATSSASLSSIGDTALFRLTANDDHRRRHEYVQQQQQQHQFEGRHHCIGDYMDHAPPPPQQQQQQQQFEVCHVLRGGHRGVVRGWCSLSQSVMVTAGEDARLCEWNRRQQSQPPHQQQHQHQSTFLSAPPQQQPPQRLPFEQLVEQESVVHDANHKRTSSGVGSPCRRQRHKLSTSPY